MDRSLSAEEAALAQLMRGLLDQYCPISVVRELQEQASDGFPTQLWPELARAGILGVAIPADAGGEGGSAFELGLVFQEAGRALCPTALYSTLLFACALDRLGTDDQRRTLLPAVARGELTGTTALLDPEDYLRIDPVLTAEYRHGSWLVSGTATFVQNAETADRLLVLARTFDDGEPWRLIGFLVDPRDHRLRPRRLNTLGRDRQSELDFRQLPVPATDVVIPDGRSGIDHSDLVRLAALALALQCMEMAGGAQRVLDLTVEYIKQRLVFGHPIASFQAAQHLIADMRIAVDGARLASHSALWWISEGDTAVRSAAIAKWKCSEAYKYITLAAHQLHGGMGYVVETNLHLWTARAKATEILGGSGDTALMHLADELRLRSGRYQQARPRHIPQP